MSSILSIVSLHSFAQVQAQAAASHEFPRPSRRTRRTQASRLAPLPATSAAHPHPQPPETASAALPLLDPPDIVSRQMDDATAQSQDYSWQAAGPAASASAAAVGCDSAVQEVSEVGDGECEADPMPQPTEGTPVSSNRRHYRVRHSTAKLGRVG